MSAFNIILDRISNLRNQNDRNTTRVCNDVHGPSNTEFVFMISISQAMKTKKKTLQEHLEQFRYRERDEIETETILKAMKCPKKLRCYLSNPDLRHYKRNMVLLKDLESLVYT